MEIVYSIFIGMISRKIASKIASIGLQCRRDSSRHCGMACNRKQGEKRAGCVFGSKGGCNLTLAFIYEY